MELFLTIIAGVSVFAIGQIVLKLIIEPIQEFKKTISLIAHDLILYANVYTSPGAQGDEKQAEMSQQMRKLSSMLRSNMCLIPKYDKTRILFGLPKRKDVSEAAGKLIAISNCNISNCDKGIENARRAQHIREALGIYIPEGERLNPECED